MGESEMPDDTPENIINAKESIIPDWVTQQILPS
jgi:hypothetical protein